MPELDGAGGSCYKGQNPQLWAKHVKALNNLHSSVYPQVLDKNADEKWIRVKQEYPELKGFSSEKLQPGYQAIDFLLTEMDKIDKSKATRDENSAMYVFEQTRKFMDIMKSRNKAKDIYNKIIPECTEIQTKEYNNSVLLLKLQYQRANGDRKDELENKMMDRFSAYQESKSKMEATLKEFKASSSALAQHEGLKFNENFNKFPYLNYYQMLKQPIINNKTIKSYLDEQESCWNDCLSCLDHASQNKTYVEQLPQAQDPNRSREMLEESRKKEKQASFKHKLKMFRDAYKEAEHCLSGELSLVELQASYKEITEVQGQLKELTYDHEIEVSEEWVQFINNSKKLTRDLIQSINNIQTQKANESERRKQEFNANIRSLEAVKLLPLTGSEDFIAWKKNQKFLNTHTDPYKKAAALLATLRNPQDKKMCETIYNFDKLVDILNDKYNHSEKLVPALKGKLDKLPVAHSDGVMLDNMRTILNVYEQLKEISAKDCFDGSVVASLMKKLPSTKKDFERYKIRKKELEYLQANNTLSHDEDGHNLSLKQNSSKDKMDLSIVDNSPEHRLLFLQFIREEVSVLDYTSEETHMTKPREEGKCGKCKQPQRYCRCHKASKVHVYNLEASKVCLICNTKEPHLNKHNKPSSSLGRCPKFREMTLEEKNKQANQHKACFVCLVPGHSMKECTIKTNCYKCDKSRHHPQICKEEKKAQVEVNAIGCTERQIEGLKWSPGTNHLIVTKVKVLHEDYHTGGPNANKFKMVNAMWDSGGLCNMIHKNLPKELGYTGRDVNLNISTITGEKQVQSKEHMICIMDNNNKIHYIKSYENGAKGYAGINKAGCQAIPRKLLFKLATKFEVPVSQISNVNGPIEMLIGVQHDKLAPTKFKYLDSEDCCLYTTNFGPKPYLIAGHIKDERNEAGDTGYKCEVNFTDIHNSSFWTGDQLGTNTEPK